MKTQMCEYCPFYEFGWCKHHLKTVKPDQALCQWMAEKKNDS